MRSLAQRTIAPIFHKCALEFHRGYNVSWRGGDVFLVTVSWQTNKPKKINLFLININYLINFRSSISFTDAEIVYTDGACSKNGRMNAKVRALSGIRDLCRERVCEKGYLCKFDWKEWRLESILLRI